MNSALKLEYSFYIVGTDGHIRGPAEKFSFMNDAQAIERANRVAEFWTIEIWQSSRLVARIGPKY